MHRYQADGELMSQDQPQTPDSPAATTPPATGHADFAASTTTVTDVRDPHAQPPGAGMSGTNPRDAQAPVGSDPGTERGWWMPSYQPSTPNQAGEANWG